MRAMPETDMITLRPMEEVVNHIGFDEFKVFIKLIGLYYLLKSQQYRRQNDALPPFSRSEHIVSHRKFSALF